MTRPTREHDPGFVGRRAALGALAAFVVSPVAGHLDGIGDAGPEWARRSVPLLATLRQGNTVASPTPPRPGPWVPDTGDGWYRNPVLFADYSDPDAVRVGNDFFLVSSSFQCAPGIPVLHSTDLVNWTIVGHAAERLPSPRYDTPQRGNGIWAPSLRYRDGQFHVYFGDPDLGVFLATAADPRGPWSPLHLVAEARGWIDPCPLWDTDGRAYLVHAWAKSRAGFNSVLTVRPLSPDGRRVTGEGVTVFDGHAAHPTIEGPKFYRRHGYYYIFAPAGGVTGGWQTVLRSRQVLGPYDDRIVLAQGRTGINGPHQGAWVETAAGQSWFLHFQDRGAHGRVVHLQPMTWHDNWPVIGDDADGDGTGEPVERHRKPVVAVTSAVAVPQTSDDFSTQALGLQWQWNANSSPAWYSLSARPGVLRLSCVPAASADALLWAQPNLLMQKFPAPSFTVTAALDGARLRDGERAALVVLGADYAYVGLAREAGRLRVVRATCREQEAAAGEVFAEGAPLTGTRVRVRVLVTEGARCEFGASIDDGPFATMGGVFQARADRWIGARVGLVALAPAARGETGSVDVEAFLVE